MPAPITIAIGTVASGKTYMACAELLRHLLCTPIFQAILDNKVKGQQKGIALKGIALNEYKLLRSAPMQILLPFDGRSRSGRSRAATRSRGSTSPMR